MLSKFMIVVIDTNVFVSALLSKGSASRQILRACFERKLTPLMGNALFAEYESLINRHDLFDKTPLSPDQREDFLNDFLGVCRWIDIHYLWRPNLPDEADNHVMELAVAGGARAIITGNIRDFRNSELVFTDIKITTAHNFLERKD